MAKKVLKRGIFMTFEGVEGCGKSTQAKIIHEDIVSEGYDCILTREPGGTRVGEMIREILLRPENTALVDIAELLLFEASRAQIVEEVIRPALRKKQVVICDRFYDATTAYQGYGGGFNKADLKRMNDFATGGLKPDLTIILDIESQEGLRRACRFRGEDRMEAKELAYHRRVRKGYMDIAKKEPKRVRLIRTRDSLEETRQIIKKEVLGVLRRYSISG